MTSAEFEFLYKQASNEMPIMTMKAMKKMLSVYEEAAKQAATVVKSSLLKGLSSLTSDAWLQIQLQLESGANLIRNQLESIVPQYVEMGTNKITAINEQYLMNIAALSGGKITRLGIDAMLTAIDNRVLQSIVSRIYQDGYTYSQRVWNVGLAYQDSIKDVVALGLSQARDVIDIAKDLNVFVTEGKQALMLRYGKLVRGTAQFAYRIKKSVYYPSLRLVRSELGASLMDQAKLQGLYNPGCSGLWDWVRENWIEWNCICPDNAHNSPYTYEKIPAYAHSNCMCHLVQRLRNQSDFMADLKSWANGNSVDYLDSWYQNRYPNIYKNLKIREAA